MSTPGPAQSTEQVEWFATTHWSIVQAARRTDSCRGRAALETLCSLYWPPLYAYVRRRGYTPHDAQDLTQAFFARLLEKDYLQAVDPRKGKFRSFLLVALRHALSDQRDRAMAAKRGGGAEVLSLDADEAEGRYRLEPIERLDAQTIYDPPNLTFPFGTDDFGRDIFSRIIRGTIYSLRVALISVAPNGENAIVVSPGANMAWDEGALADVERAAADAVASENGCRLPRSCGSLDRVRPGGRLNVWLPREPVMAGAPRVRGWTAAHPAVVVQCPGDTKWRTARNGHDPPEAPGSSEALTSGRRTR